MIWNWDIDIKPENAANISGIQALEEVDDLRQMDSSIVVTRKKGSNFEEFNQIDFEMAK